MNYRELCQRLMRVYDAGEARAVAGRVLEDRFSLTRTDVLCEGMEKLTAAQQQELEVLTQRLERGEPIQYVLGETVFYGRRFEVAAGVLIPRPETEELCALVTTAYGAAADNIRLLDIGTGSGCIAVTLALELPHVAVTAFDISQEALIVARKNASLLNAKVTFEERNILLDTQDDGRQEAWDAIVSNPPYICRQEAKDMEVNVLNYEPHLALFVPDDDPLLFYRAIACYGRKTLRPGGHLFFEINPLYASELTAMLQQKGYDGIQMVNDQFGRQRFVVAKLNNDSFNSPSYREEQGRESI